MAAALGLAGLLLAVLPPRTTAEEPSAEERKLLKKATDLNDEAVQLYQKGQYDNATKLYQEALKIRPKVYSRKKYPLGHPDLATSLNNLGFLPRAQGEHGLARTYYERALAMREGLYPKDRYPQGHSELAQSLRNRPSPETAPPRASGLASRCRGWDGDSGESRVGCDFRQTDIRDEVLREIVA
jgi:tetratricopeptide (TPR) repeat protein